MLRICVKRFFLYCRELTFKLGKHRMSDKEEMVSDGSLNVTLTLRLLMHGKVTLTDAEVVKIIDCIFVVIT